jgi:hypothetical protein
MDCHYCGKPATRLDLCHQLVPVCAAHQGLGHQIGALPPAKPKSAPK